MAGGPIDRFVAMKIPAWAGPGRSWPESPRLAELARIQAAEQRQRIEYERSKSPEAKAAAQAKLAAEEAKWRHYRVTHAKAGFIEVDCRSGTACLFADDQPVLMMTEQQVAAAKAKGCKVEPANAGDRSTFAGGISMATPL